MSAATIAPLEARCKVCGDTGSKDQDIDGFLNCTDCDAVERRMEMQNYISGLSPNMSNWAKCWAAYNFGMHRPTAAVSAAKWIDIKERQPALHEVVALLNTDVNMNVPFESEIHWTATGYLADGGNQMYWSVFGEGRSVYYDYITHWAPLPQQG